VAIGVPELQGIGSTCQGSVIQVLLLEECRPVTR
jgi:hypothetical protein